MLLVDSCGWLEYLTDGLLADAYAPLIEGDAELLVPAIVFFEVYKFIKRSRGEEAALLVAAQLQRHKVVDLDSVLAMEAADCGIDHGLAMADAVVYATSLHHGAQLVTSDRDFKGLAGVRWIPKGEPG